MPELKTRFRGADHIPTPDLWQDIARRQPRPTGSDVSPFKRVVIASVAFALAAVAIAFAMRAFNGRPTPASSPRMAPKQNGLIYFQFGGGDGGTWTDAIQPDGSGRTTIFGRDSYVSHIAWSPDGTKIAYVGIVQYGNQSPDGQVHFGIFVANPDGSGAQQLTDGVNEGWPSWSPDGTQIAFSSTRADPAVRECASGTQSSCPTDIYLMNAGGSAITRLTDDPAPEYAPAWSPDGTRIAFVRTNGDTNEIDVMNPDGTGITGVASGTIAGMGGVEHPFSWSPDGSQIVFMSVAGATSEIHIVNADGTGERKIFGEDGVVSEDPIWSPDGTEIAFSSTFGAYPPGCGVGSDVCSDLFVMRPDGSHVTRLTQGTPGVFGIAWQPVPTSSPSPTPSLTASPTQAAVTGVFDVGARGQTNAITYGFGSIWVSEYGADVATGQLHRLDPETGKEIADIPVQVATTWEFGGGGLTVGDGSVWVAGVSKGGSELVRVDPSTDEVVASIPLGPGNSADVVADPSGIWVLSFSGGGGPMRVDRVDPATNDVVATIPIDYVYGHRIFSVDGLIVAATNGASESAQVVPTTVLSVIDPATNTVVRKILLGQSSTAEGDGVLWAALDGTLATVDPGTGELTNRGVLPPGDVVIASAGEGGFWWYSGYGSGHPSIHRFDQASGLDGLSVDLPVETTPIAIGLSPGAVWVLNNEGTFTRVQLG